MKALRPIKMLVSTCPKCPTRLKSSETPCYENLGPNIVPDIDHHSDIL